mgnify:CR=1 FL=1
MKKRKAKTAKRKAKPLGERIIAEVRELRKALNIFAGEVQERHRFTSYDAATPPDYVAVFDAAKLIAAREAERAKGVLVDPEEDTEPPSLGGAGYGGTIVDALRNAPENFRVS